MDTPEFSLRRPWELLTRPVHRRQAVLIVALFCPFVAIGTLLHEAGHIAVAQALGYDTTLFFDSMTWASGPNLDPKTGERDSCRISAGGPALNIAIGTVGLIWLAALGPQRRRSWEGWVATLTALFWSRQLFNLLTAVAGVLLGKAGNGDEGKIAVYLGWPAWSLDVAGGLVSFGVCVAVIALQPAERRWHVLIAGPIGCVVGLVVWMGLLGPVLLPK